LGKQALPSVNEDSEAYQKAGDSTGSRILAEGDDGDEGSIQMTAYVGGGNKSKDGLDSPESSMKVRIHYI
jgi:hypothetical protein